MSPFIKIAMKNASSGGAPRRGAAPRRRKVRGSIIVAVLAIIALLSFILLEFMEEATSKIKYYGLFYNRDDLRTEAYSILETSLAVIDEIREIDRGLYSPVQGWKNPLRYARIEPPSDLKVSIKINDETAKISLARADPLVLKILFEELEIPFSDAEIMTDSLLDWIDTDDLPRLNGAESDFYDNDEVPYQPANGPIQSWEEFRLIRGFDTAFFNENGVPNATFFRFKEAISLEHDSPVNLNSANNLVLTVISRVEGYDTLSLYDYLNGDDGERGTGDDRLIDSRNNPYFPAGAQARGGMADLQSQLLKVEVSVGRGEADFLVTALVAWTGSNPSANVNAAKTQPQTNPAKRGKKTAAETDLGAALGYPFKIVRLTENFKI